MATSSFDYGELLDEMQRNTMINMEPESLSKQCKVKKYREICNSSFFWQEYFRGLSSKTLNRYLLKIAKHNQYALRAAYKGLIDSEMSNMIKVSTIGSLIIISIMRDDKNLTDDLINLYKNRADEDRNIFDREFIYKHVEHMVDYWRDNTSGRLNVPSVHIFKFAYNKEYLVELIMDKVGIDKFFDLLVQRLDEPGNHSGVEWWVSHTFMLLSENGDVEHIQQLKDKLSRKWIIEYYLDSIANYLPVNLYDKLDIPNLGLYISEPIDVEHLIEAAKYLDKPGKLNMTLSGVFEPEKFVDIVSNLNIDDKTKYKFIQLYELEEPENIELWNNRHID